MIFKGIIESITNFNNNVSDVLNKANVIAETQAFTIELEAIYNIMALGLSEAEAKEQLNINNDIEETFFSLLRLNPDSAMLVIEYYLKNYKGTLLFQSSQIQKFMLEIKKLEKRLQELSEQKSKYLNDIDKFSREYYLKLGLIIQEILKLKREVLRKEIESKNQKHKEEKALHVETQNIYNEIHEKINELKEFLEDENDERYEEINQVYEELKENLKELKKELKNQKETIKQLEDEIENKDYEKAKTDYEEFNSEYERIKKENENGKGEIKKVYKTGSRIYHTNKAANELKKPSRKIMQVLNEAYSRKDLKIVKKILTNLAHGVSFDISSDKTDNRKALKDKIGGLREGIDKINEELEIIKQNDTFKTISGLDDWNEYFESMKYALEEEIQNLKEQLEVTFVDSLEIEEELGENDEYNENIKNIEQPTFEKIRRYCSNLVDDGDDDELSSYLAVNGKMHKALVYDAMEQFLEELEDESLTLIDWGCTQGLASSLVLDYINEKELDIEIEKVILIDENKTNLSRAMLHVETLGEDDFEVETLHVKDGKLSKELDIDSSSITLNLFANDYMPIDLGDIDCDMFDEAYFVCLSNTDKNFVSEVYESLDDFLDIQNVSMRDDNIGKYQRFEKICKTI